MDGVGLGLANRRQPEQAAVSQCRVNSFCRYATSVRVLLLLPQLVWCQLLLLVLFLQILLWLVRGSGVLSLACPP
jgi:hypothetical protein